MLMLKDTVWILNSIASRILLGQCHRNVRAIDLHIWNLWPHRGEFDRWRFRQSLLLCWRVINNLFKTACSFLQALNRTRMVVDDSCLLAFSSSFEGTRVHVLIELYWSLISCCLIHVVRVSSHKSIMWLRMWLWDHNCCSFISTCVCLLKLGRVRLIRCIACMLVMNTVSHQMVVYLTGMWIIESWWWRLLVLAKSYVNLLDSMELLLVVEISRLVWHIHKVVCVKADRNMHRSLMLAHYFLTIVPMQIVHTWMLLRLRVCAELIRHSSPWRETTYA